MPIYTLPLVPALPSFLLYLSLPLSFSLCLNCKVLTCKKKNKSQCWEALATGKGQAGCFPFSLHSPASASPRSLQALSSAFPGGPWCCGVHPGPASCTQLSLCFSVSKQKAFLPRTMSPIGCCCLQRKLQACTEQHRCEHAQSSAAVSVHHCKRAQSSNTVSTDRAATLRACTESIIASMHRTVLLQVHTELCCCKLCSALQGQRWEVSEQKPAGISLSAGFAPAPGDGDTVCLSHLCHCWPQALSTQRRKGRRSSIGNLL